MRPPISRHRDRERIERRLLGPVGNVVVAEVLVYVRGREHDLGGDAELGAPGRVQVADVLVSDDGAGERAVVGRQQVDGISGLLLERLVSRVAV